MAEIFVARISLKLAWSLFAPAGASRLEQGDVTEEKIRQMLLNEFQKINEHLNALRRKELVAAIGLLETGVELFQKDNVTSLQEFHKCREHAQMAFGVVADISDKILATKILVVATLHEFHDNLLTAKSLCLKYLERVNSLPEVARSCELVFSPEGNFSSKILCLSGKSKRDNLLNEVAEINMTVYNHLNESNQHIVPSAICFGKYHINPLTDMILYRLPKVVTELPVELTEFISVCYSEPYIFASLSQNGSLNNDVVAINCRTGNIKHLFGHEKSVMSVCANEKFLFSASFDKNIVVWDIASLDPVKILSGHEGCVKSVCLTAERLFSGSTDGTVRIWSLETFSCEHILNVAKPVIKLVCSRRKFLFCLCGLNEVQIWDSIQLKLLHSFSAPGMPFSIVANDNYLYILTSSPSETTVQCWNLGSLTLNQSFAVSTNFVKCCDTPYFFCGDKTIQMSSSASGKLIIEQEVVLAGNVADKIKTMWMNSHELFVLCRLQNKQQFIVKY